MGAVGLGLGTVFLLKAGSKHSQADDLCTLPGGACPTSQKDAIDQLDNEAKKAKGAAIAGFVVGGIGIAAGVTLLMMSNGASSNQASIQPWIGLGSAGVSGRF